MSYLDTRTLQEELDELEQREDDEDEEPLDEDERDRLEALRELRDTIGSAEWDSGATLIPESEFEDYARELAEDIGAVPSDLGWPATCIDWEQAADALAMDYTSVTFDGEDYYVRL